MLDEGVILEIVRPGTGDPVPDGEVGEVVDHRAEPRLPAWCASAPATCRPCCRALPQRAQQHRIQGLAGPRRPDRQGARHVRAPSQVAEVARRHPEVARRAWWSGEMANDA